jgi:hypothetical protein
MRSDDNLNNVVKIPENHLLTMGRITHLAAETLVLAIAGINIVPAKTLRMAAAHC